MKDNQPSLAAALVDLPWWDARPDLVEKSRGHGRVEVRSVWARSIKPAEAPAGFPSARQAVKIIRERANLRGLELGNPEVAFVITSLPRSAAAPRVLAGMLRGHWCIENGLHYIRDVTFDEDRSRIRTGSGPRVMASLRNLAIAIHCLHGEKNIASATRRCCRIDRRAFARLCARAIKPAHQAA